MLTPGGTITDDNLPPYLSACLFVRNINLGACVESMLEFFEVPKYLGSSTTHKTRVSARGIRLNKTGSLKAITKSTSCGISLPIGYR